MIGAVAFLYIILTKCNVTNSLQCDVWVLQTLKDAGADDKAVNGKGVNALMLSCHHNQAAVLELLLNSSSSSCEVSALAAGSCRDLQGRTCLMHAAAGGAADVVQLLLRHKEAWGIDVDAIDAEGLNAVFYAVKGGSSKVLQLLHEAGMPLIGLSRSRASRYVPYGKQQQPQQQQHPAQQQQHQEQKGQQQQQLQKEVGFTVQPQSCGGDSKGSRDAACNGKKPEGDGLLWLACEEGSLDVVKWLLQQGIGES